MSVLKLKPSCKDYLWGGHRLVEEYGKEYDGEILAETWELSCHPDGPSTIVNGAYAGKTLEEYIEAEGKEVLGTNCRRFRDFPILTKFIDAKQDLSIQVHPDNRYALKNEGQYGKTEMWYVVDAGKEAFLYYGFKKEVSKEEFARRIREDTLLEVLNAVPVQKGDVLFIESGTIHAIGKDILIAEIQQNSNVTYRVYDYGRVGKDGKKRDLHIEKAIAVTNRVPLIKSRSSYPHVADCDYFTVDKLNLDGRMMCRVEGTVSEESFVSILILDGEGVVSCGNKVSYQKGDSLFLPAGSGTYVIEGSCDALITTIRAKAAPVRIGIDIGGTDTKIGLVDVHNKLLDSVCIPTKAERPADEVIRTVAETALSILDKNGIAMEQCVGVGIGVPGTVDRKKGIVRYSNNIRWEDVPLVKEMSTYLPIPVEIANDADCAALGETIAGAGKECSDVVMITLGTGVGGGVVLDGEIYEGRGIGGSELGHMVIVENGEPCTCGRRGCLEAYASATALKREAKRASKKELIPSEIFALAKQGDPAMKEVVEIYIRRLGLGIVNIVNIFRPQLVLLGGGISGQGESLLVPLRRILREECFGGERGDVPEIEEAVLGNNAGIIGAAGLL
ncbi:type I phosphomannose isomerase catalytic subunit [Mediterraneibacter gnavus]|uniref:type I phosphomannose isomerase catalytic subunit n=1 Tax=Mediterraneibacter gnavus TaxID=33038 RepID=UPI00299F76FF|nr:type I phosphomannose isomerase catalytic subunit [Mediterraneibacter gnavus]